MSTHLIIPDQHAHPDFHNNRADYLGKLICDLKPDVVVNIGDAADMPSMCSYDKGTKAFHGRNYERDINSHNDFQDRIWSPVKKRKRRLPKRYFIEGNHEHRIKRAISLSPELEGEKFGVSFKDLQLDRYYDTVVEYNGGTPGVITVDGVSYAHYFISGVMGRAISGEHPAYSLITKQFRSCTAGHLHTLDYCTRTDTFGNRLHGIVCGVYQDFDADFAGEANRMWWPGVVVKYNVENGDYDPQFISLDKLRKEYG